MPEHDLEPPKFSRRALERLLYDWKAVKAMVSTGQKVCVVLSTQGPATSMVLPSSVAWLANWACPEQSQAALVDGWH